MAYEHNDIVNKTRLAGELGEELMGFEHNDIVTVDVMEKAIAEGGGGGADGIKTAKVTFTVNAGAGGGGLDGGVEGTQNGFVFLFEYGVRTIMGASAGNTVELTAILTGTEGEYRADYFVIGSNPVAAGECELSENGENIIAIITGDCTITVDPVTL